MTLQVTVVRHPLENLAKCSLSPLHGRPGFQFYTAHPGFVLQAGGHTVLRVGAPPLSVRDACRPLLLLDSTWRHLASLERCLLGTPIPRGLPALPSSYPRVSKLYEDPEGGLASVEALYVASRVLGQRDDSLLDHYRWRDRFISDCDRLL